MPDVNPDFPRSGRRAPWRGWLHANPLLNLIQVVVATALLLLVPIYYVRSERATLWHALAIAFAFVAIWVVARWMVERYGSEPTMRQTFGWIGITFIFVEAISIVSNGEFFRIASMLLPIIAVFHLPRRWSLAITIGTVLWIVGSYLWLPVPRPSIYPLQDLMFLTFIYFSGYALALALLQEQRARQDAQGLLRELAQSNEQLTRYAAEATQLATERERNRIARDIHDSLGHHLTAVGVQLEKAIAFEHVDPVEANRAVQAAKQLTDQALTEVRKSVGTLRAVDESFTLQGALEVMVDNLAASGMDVTLRWRGDEDGFAEPQLLTLFRVAQEGLTNVQKHAQAKQVHVDVELDAEGAVLTLSDDGVGYDATAVQQGGYGLRGLRERAAQVHGSLTLGRSPTGGAQLTMKLPREETE